MVLIHQSINSNWNLYFLAAWGDLHNTRWMRHGECSFSKDIETLLIAQDLKACFYSNLYPSCHSIYFSFWQFTLVDESPKLPKWSSTLFPFPPASSLELIWSNFLREVSFLLSSLFSHSACLLLKTTYCNSSETLPFANHHLLIEFNYSILFF